jgi:hypothetical protein
VVAFISTAERAATSGGQNDPELSCAKTGATVSPKNAPKSQASGLFIQRVLIFLLKNIDLTSSQPSFGPIAQRRLQSSPFIGFEKTNA